ncbi:MAG: hypothetical protein AAGB16_10790, partial [Pseudomonadota bacterium]
TMHIIAILVGFVGFIAVWYWRLKVLGEAAREGRKVAETVANLPRKMRFKNKSGKGGLAVVDDPREAAAILMLEVAQARGTLTERQEAVIRGEIMHHFEFPEGDANALITQAGWLSRNAGASHVVMSKMTDFVRNSPGMTDKEIVDLDGMLVAISEAEGDPTESQLDLLTIYRQKTGLRV